MDKRYEKLISCLDQIKSMVDFKPDIALVLGSGLGGFADEIDAVKSVDYNSIEGFPVSTVVGHKGRFVFGYLGGVKVVAMQGRVHYYEGYELSDVVLPTRLMGMLGAKAIFLTNASGGINRDFSAGDFMMITDHVSAFFPNPLIGANIEELGTRFPDMSNVYDKKLCAALKEAAKEENVTLKEGVYAQLTGPSFETPAEIRMLERLGVDAVGMSTVCEAIAARHMGMRVCGISCIANKAAGLSENPLTHDEVQAAADKAAPEFKRLLRSGIAKIAKVIG